MRAPTPPLLMRLTPREPRSRSLLLLLSGIAVLLSSAAFAQNVDEPAKVSPTTTTLEQRAEQFASAKNTPLTQCERRLVYAIAHDQPCDCSGEGTDTLGVPSVAANKPATGRLSRPDATIRTEVLKGLLTDASLSSLWKGNSLSISGAYVDSLDLNDVVIKRALSFTKCKFKSVDITKVSLPSLEFIHCEIPQFEATQLTLEDDLGFHNCSIPILRLNRLTASSVGISDSELTDLRLENIAVDNFVGIDHDTVEKMATLSGKVGELSIYNCTIGTPDADGSLSAKGLQVEHSVTVMHSMVNGTVNFSKAKVRENLSFLSTTITGPQKKEGSEEALDASHLVVDGTLTLSQGTVPSLDLSSATIGVIYTEQPSWPEPGKLKLRGLPSDEISNETSKKPQSPGSILPWLALEGAAPGAPPVDRVAYDRLAKSYEDSGRHSDSAQVEIEKYDKILTLEKPSLPYWQYWLGTFFRITVAYGYEPFRVLAWMAGFTALGALIFGLGHRAGLMAPTEKEAFDYFISENRSSSPPPSYRGFNPVLFSIEAIVPFISFHQAENWFPREDRSNRTAAVWLRRYLYFHMIIGWILASILVISLSPDGPTRFNALWS